jgi:diguanylate cyclase (GGDEF)-like protein
VDEGTETPGTWLCPTEFDRARTLDMEERLQVARAILFGSLGVGCVVGLPWLGWWPALLVTAQVTIYALLRRLIARSARPEYPIATAVVSAQVMIAVAVALTGGAQSPLLLVFLVGVVGMPARFGTTRVIAAGLLLTEVLIFASTAGADPAGFAADPGLAILTATSSFGLVAFSHALMQAESQKRSESVVDTLTGLENRRGMEGRFDELRAAAVANDAPLALLLCDLDLFKAINDRHGHQRGDTVLVAAAAAIRACLRSSESVYRVGGEEFLVLLPGCDAEQAAPVGERVRAAVEAAQPGGLSVTASVGVGAATGAAIDFDELFRAADAALYEAKRSGRNRVVLSGISGGSAAA